MNRLVLGLAMVGLASLGATAQARAQATRFGLGGGLAAPTGDYGSVDKGGWHALAKVDFAIPMAPVGVRVEGLYGRTTHKDQSGAAVPGNTQLAGGLASLVWNVPMRAPLFKPYLLAGAGVYHVKVSTSLGDASETKLAFGGGAGGSFGAGPARFFVEGRYLRVQETGGAMTFFPITAGVTFGL
jgi:opacity protein-like surface antigen